MHRGSTVRVPVTVGSFSIWVAWLIAAARDLTRVRRFLVLW